MKSLFFLLTLLLLTNSVLFALNIKIVESQSINPGHDMDNEWLAIATSLGHTATIVPQTTITNNSFFGTTDILIVSSGVIAISAVQLGIIQQFMQTGKSVYLQAEYLNTYTTNGGFQTIVNNLGGSFSWGGTSSGDLAPMSVIGTLATTNLSISPLSYYWYGNIGSGTTGITPFLQAGSNYYGFIFCPTNEDYGDLITNSDQDWIRACPGVNSNEGKLMKNIITHLANGSACGTPLSLSPLRLTAEKRNKQILLSWNNFNEDSYSELILERGKSTESYQEIKNGLLQSSNFTDEPSFRLDGWYYRLHRIDFEGKSDYSTEVFVESDEITPFSVFPQPVTSGAANLKLYYPETGAVMIQILDLQGKTVFTKNLFAEEGNGMHELDVAGLENGLYLVEVNLGKLVFSRPMVIQR